MKHVVLSSELAKIDAASQEIFKLPALTLMESAAMGVWGVVESRIGDKDASLVFLCGGGNNGGDALAVARLAYNSGFRKLLCILSGKRLSSSCERQLEILTKYGIETITVDETVPVGVEQAIAVADFLFDGLAGTGLQGPLRGKALDLALIANKSKATTIAIDIPSGLSEGVSACSPHCKADLTITFGMRKLAMYHPMTRSDCGEIVVRNPSFPPQLLEKAPIVADIFTAEDMTLKKLPASSYKNKRGHLGIVGGSKEYTGAARLSARSAFAARAGLVTLFCDQDVYPIAAAEAPSVMVRVLGDESDLAPFDALLVGPGWGSGRSSLLEKIFSLNKSVVLDADGITAYAELLRQGKTIAHGPLILTPHLGELRSLVSALYAQTPDDTPLTFFTMAQDIADRLDAVLVVKSSLVHMAFPGEKRMAVVEGLNPSLGVAGSGDVLSGILSALVAGGSPGKEAALQGVLIHQGSGSLAHAKCGYYDSETLIHYLGQVVMGAER
ncbi:MAG: NAD(P)H-hydrate dehydratase [Spirochaetia bacterium]|nr:NAD(P)H-hydrate dehydratase [Spirochaetia bacterium]